MRDGGGRGRGNGSIVREEGGNGCLLYGIKNDDDDDIVVVISC